VDLDNFATARRSSQRVVNLARQKWTLSVTPVIHFRLKEQFLIGAYNNFDVVLYINSCVNLCDNLEETN